MLLWLLSFEGYGWAIIYPCLCLCFGFSQITLIRPFLLMILHLSQIGFTDALTFIKISPFKTVHRLFCKKSATNNYSTIYVFPLQVIFSTNMKKFTDFLLFSPFNTTLCQIIRRQFQCNLITR